MSVWETIRRWFTSEAASAKDLVRDLESEWSAELDRKEAGLSATPEEHLERLQDKISDNTSAFDEIRAKIESSDVDLDSPDEPSPT
ncbi:MAG: hypothetical protein OER95_16485 [Acidimicrobiia bacterium]|nr:hypothetical protein [Acidimicrobiia bacterium]